MKNFQQKKSAISRALIDTVSRRVAQDKQVRRTLPENGRLHVDRQLPFLCVYRRPHDRDDAGTDRLVKSGASYLIAPGGPEHHESVAALVRELTTTLSPEFGAFLIVEVWAGPDGGKANDAAVPTVLPTFTIHAPTGQGVTRTVEVLERRLGRIKVLKQGVSVDVVWDDPVQPPGLPPLLPPAEAESLNCVTIGLTVPPVYRRPDSQESFPLLMRSLARSLGRALRQAFFEFTRTSTSYRPAHYHVLGRKAVVKAVWEVDRRLAEVSDAFDYLLQLTPVNSGTAYERFSSRNFERVPEFHYRPLPFDPGQLKRQLYQVPVERVEDPALQRLFQQKQEELELKITMLRDRDTPRFLHESLQLFGAVDDALLAQATSILESLPQSRSAKNKKRVSAKAFAERARAQFGSYKEAYPGFKASTQITQDVTGLMVSRGKLLIHEGLSVAPARVEALLAHEVGTHLVTYFNGRAQPFRQLYSGMAAYEELQEGLAVLAEYLVGGLTGNRLRQLAARVVAARLLIDGASFVDTFRILNQDHGFPQRTAYSTTMRVFRGGGFTKDAIYLRGLHSVVEYLRKGGELDVLYVGKLALNHLPIIRELLHRKVLEPTPVAPGYIRGAKAEKRLNRIREGEGSVLDLVCDKEPA